MAHEHHHHQSANIKTAFFLNLAFTIIELAGGMFTNSMAIFSDALHDLGDSLSLAIAWYLEKYAHRAPDYKYSYGYARFSLLGALINSLILIFGSLVIIFNAIGRLFNPAPVRASGMVALAVLGIAVNGVAAWRLFKGTSLNEKVVSWHLLEDVLGWVVVLVGSIVMYFYDLAILDPLLSVSITIYILANVVPKMFMALRILMEGVPTEYPIARLLEQLKQFEQLKDVHHVHLWSMEGQRMLASFHIVVSDDITNQEVISLKQRIRSHLEENGIDHITIEVDYQSENWQEHNCE